MYIDVSKASNLLKEIENETVNKDNLETLQKVEDTIRLLKQKAAIELYSRKNRLNKETFFELLASIINIDIYEIEYYYYISRHYDYDKEISERRKAFMTIIGSINNVNNNVRPCSYSVLIQEVERLLDEEIDFLFCGTDDDTFLTDIIKTDSEIILPYGNPIKIVKGKQSKQFESSIRLACDTSNALGFPVTLKLRS